MPRSNAAEAMPEPQEEPKKPEDQEEELEVTPDMIIEDSEDAFEVKEELEVEEKEKKAKRKKDMAELRKKLEENRGPSEDVEESLAELKKIARERELEEAEKGGREEAAAEREATLSEREEKSKGRMRRKMEMDELRGKLSDIKKKREEGEGFTEQEKAWFKEGEDMSAEADKETAFSIEPYLEKVRGLDVPDLDMEAFDEKTRRHAKLTEEYDDAASGELEVGWWKKWKMKRELNKLSKELESAWRKVDDALAELKDEQRFKDMSDEEQEAVRRLETYASKYARRRSPEKKGSGRAGNIKP